VDPISAAANAGNIKTDYMKLLVTQLQYQNPLEPMNNNEMASQLTQLSSLEQLESINTNFAQVLATTEYSYATSLIGKQISFPIQTEDNTTDICTETVRQVYKDVQNDNQLSLVTENYNVTLDQVLSVSNY